MNGKRIRSASWSPALALGFLLAVAPALRADDRRPADGCSVASLKGSFGYYRTGFTPDGPLAAVGIITYDGKGHATTTQNISRNGEVEYDVSFDGVYEVNADCTGRGLTPDGTVEITRLVVINDGDGVLLFSESPGNSVYGVATKIHPGDRH